MIIKVEIILLIKKKDFQKLKEDIQEMIIKVEIFLLIKVKAFQIEKETEEETMKINNNNKAMLKLKDQEEEKINIQIENNKTIMDKDKEVLINFTKEIIDKILIKNKTTIKIRTETIKDIIKVLNIEINIINMIQINNMIKDIILNIDKITL